MSDFSYHPHIEVLSAADGVRRRHWSDADKIRIVEESFVGHRQASATARRHGVSRSLLTAWRRQYRNGEFDADDSALFAPVTLAGQVSAARTESGDVSPRLREVQVEIVLTNGRRLIVPSGVDPEALTRILAVADRS